MRWMTRQASFTFVPRRGAIIRSPAWSTRTSAGTRRQGLTLVHSSAQPEPFLTLNAPYTSPTTP